MIAFEYESLRGFSLLAYWALRLYNFFSKLLNFKRWKSSNLLILWCIEYKDILGSLDSILVNSLYLLRSPFPCSLENITICISVQRLKRVKLFLFFLLYEIRSELLWFVGGVDLFYSRRVAIGTC